jgi:hypothetical protein
MNGGNAMQNAFSLFYAVLFGAILSAEVGWKVFKYDPNGEEPAARTFPDYALRVVLLVILRAVFFAVVYPILSPTLNSNHWMATSQLLGCLLLCLPISASQQLLYLLKSDANPKNVSSSRSFASIFVVVSVVIVAVLLYLILMGSPAR